MVTSNVLSCFGAPDFQLLLFSENHSTDGVPPKWNYRIPAGLGTATCFVTLTLNLLELAHNAGNIGSTLAGLKNCSEC